MQSTITFGSHDHLVGIITTPEDAETAARSDVAMIFVTAGMLHSAGPFRLHNELAHAAAASGITSLRFDLSGIGESYGIGSTGSSIDRARNEIAAAMDAAESETGASKFILFGLCSGADDSVHAALSDERVAGLITMDGCGYRTSRYRWHRVFGYYLPKLIDPRKVASSLIHRLMPEQNVPSSLQLGTDVREFPDQEQATIEFQQLVDRGVHMHFVYTGGVAEYYNYADQFFDMFPEVDWNGLISTRYFADMDHVAFLREDRDELIEDIVRAARTMISQFDVTKQTPTGTYALPTSPSVATVQESVI